MTRRGSGRAGAGGVAVDAHGLGHGRPIASTALTLHNEPWLRKSR
jgi:hypothetical protein